MAWTVVGVRKINNAEKNITSMTASVVEDGRASLGLAGLRRRHGLIAASFFALVLGPVVLAAAYLYLVAADQYASSAGFTVRSEERGSAGDFLGGLSMLTNTATSDSDVLYEFITSQTLVERIDAKLNLVERFSKPGFDPVFAYDPDGTIEDLLKYWERMVKPSYASGTGLIELEVRAFTPQDAHAITVAILEESSRMINGLSAIARDDATRYAKDDLDIALARLKGAREALTLFRSKTRIIDPIADIQGQMGLLSSLKTQLAQAHIDLNLMLQTYSREDPRVPQAERRIDVIEKLIEQERTKFGMGSGEAQEANASQAYPALLGEFERLTVDVEYASKAYLAAMAAMDVANAEALRQSRYLATYAEPTMPKSALYPERITLLLLTALLLLLLWSTGVLIYYSLRDRR